MDKKVVVWIGALCIILVLALVFVFVTLKSGKVVNINTGRGYDTIMEAINANETLDGHTLVISSGLYRENVEVTKSLTIKGQNRDSVILERGNRSTFIILIKMANYVTVANLTIRNSTGAVFGLRVWNATGCNIINIRVLNLVTCIHLDLASNCTVKHNEIRNGYLRAIWLYGATNNTVIGNTITNTTQVEPGYGAINLEFSTNNTVTLNHVENCTSGIWAEQSRGNKIYHNNLIHNKNQVGLSLGWPNIWDDGYPAGGNYWSNYNGTDQYHGPDQNMTGADGIGDTPYTINTQNKDNYPLMTPQTLP